MKFKYAYPSHNRLLLSLNRRSVAPAFDEEIEIDKIDDKVLVGKVVHFEHSRIAYIPVELVREEDTYLGKKFGLFGKQIRKVKKGWVRLKKTTPIEMEIKNYKVVKILE